MSATGYSAFRQLNPDGTKKRGRPVGWRKAVHMNPSGVTVADRTKASKRVTARDAPEPEAHHPVFRCKWEGCTAELHNLKTLRAHVNKIHGRLPDGQNRHQCLWDDCGQSTTNTVVARHIGKEGQQWQRLTFQPQPEWWTHIEKQHFDPVAWQMGDGPTSGLSGMEDE